MGSLYDRLMFLQQEQDTWKQRFEQFFLSLAYPSAVLAFVGQQRTPSAQRLSPSKLQTQLPPPPPPPPPPLLPSGLSPVESSLPLLLPLLLPQPLPQPLPPLLSHQRLFPVRLPR